HSLDASQRCALRDSFASPVTVLLPSLTPPRPLAPTCRLVEVSLSIDAHPPPRDTRHAGPLGAQTTPPPHAGDQPSETRPSTRQWGQTSQRGVTCALPPSSSPTNHTWHEARSRRWRCSTVAARSTSWTTRETPAGAPSSRQWRTRLCPSPPTPTRATRLRCAPCGPLHAATVGRDGSISSKTSGCASPSA